MSLAAGARLGPYEIVSLLGEGGMGEVYRAKDSRLNRPVAIKVLSDESAADLDHRKRFEREAKVISTLDHPNICPLYDVGDHDGNYFIVMPCLEGQSLAARLKRGAVPVDEAIRVAVEIAMALNAAHRKGVVHRDLKPGNVMLTKAGVKLLDFGLAKLKSTESTLGGDTTVHGRTGTGMLVGTIGYMSPEQITSGNVDARSDIFALGAVLFEMITGKRAFKADSPGNTIEAILNDVPPPPSSIQPQSPPALDHVVAGCLAKDADDRWQSAADIARQLRWIASSSAETPAIKPRSPWPERFAWIALTAALAALAAWLAWR